MVEKPESWLPLARRAVFEAHRRDRVSMWVRGSGGSMRPLVEPGDWLHVEFGALPRRLGEIVIFALDDVLVAHRLVGRARRDGTTLLVTKGDAQRHCDPFLVPGDVLGVVRARHPRRPVTLRAIPMIARVATQIFVAQLRLAHPPTRGGGGEKWRTTSARRSWPRTRSKR